MAATGKISASTATMTNIAGICSEITSRINLPDHKKRPFTLSIESLHGLFIFPCRDTYLLRHHYGFYACAPTLASSKAVRALCSSSISRSFSPIQA